MKLSRIEDQLQHAIRCHRTGDLARAKTLYEEILAEDTVHPEVWYNLGLLHFVQQDFQKAITCFSEVLALSPGHIDALNNVGGLLLYEKNYDHALQCFLSVLATHPDHIEARNNAAATLLQLQRYQEASEHFRLLLEQMPDDLDARYGYAMALLDNDEWMRAIEQFHVILQQNPEHLDAQSNLGIAYLKACQWDKAKVWFQSTLHKQPNNQAIAYLFSALIGEKTFNAAPTEYIQQLFEHYAKHYERHLLDVLHYQAPQQLYVLLEKHIYPLPKHAWHILDLGCGTGLSGYYFRELASQLEGVDLSQKMLEIAKSKLIYTNLYQENLFSTLKRFSATYDLLLASDTFNYFGELNQVLACCKNALKTQGYLLFSVEIAHEIATWTLQRNARFAHAKDYLETIAKQTGFQIIALESTVLREQAQQPVEGWLCLLRK